MRNKKYIFLVVLTIIVMVVTSFTLFSCDSNKVEATELSNKNATAETRRLYNYLKSVYGTNVISGQQESTYTEHGSEYEMEYIHNLTGKYPAIRGLDFIRDDFDGVVERSIDWWNRGGIVSICWHCGKNFTGNYNDCKDDDIDDWDEVLTVGTEANRVFTENMDHAAAALKRLQDVNIPVLWRPFHEFDGMWFWWGKGGAKRFKQLWIYMYNHFTNDLGLNNLIWVLGYSHNGDNFLQNWMSQWYPGDEYCDIIGADSYEVPENGPEKRLFDGLSHVNKDKMRVLHECGEIPTVDGFKEVKWGFFMTWHTKWLIYDGDPDVQSSNTDDQIRAVYLDDYVLTLEDIPNLK